MKTNRTPFTDVCTLIGITRTADADGYETETETRTEIFCSISDGVARSEMYEAMKAGIRLSGTAEIWEDDYDRQEELEHEDVRYKIQRVYPTGHGTLELSLQEVVR